MLAIISPAKTLDFESPLVTDKFTLPDFAQESQELIKTLRKYDPAAISNPVSYTHLTLPTSDLV